MDDIPGDNIVLTVFLRHDQSQTLDQFQTKLDDRGWWENFPPRGVEVLSWNVVMGIGQIVTLKLPPAKLQAVNVALEKYAWGVFSTEAYVSYDFMNVRERLARESKTRNSGAVEPVSGDTAINSGAGGGNHPRQPHNGLFLQQWQAGTGEAGIYEMALGDALEKIFGRGVHDLLGVADSLNEMGIKTPQGEDWTVENYPEIMEGLGR